MLVNLTLLKRNRFIQVQIIAEFIKKEEKETNVSRAI
jgi:hypothetical protein